MHVCNPVAVLLQGDCPPVLATLCCPAGDNSNGRLGVDAQGDSHKSTIPTVVWVPPGVSSWVAVSAGDVHTCSIAIAGPSAPMYCWGEFARIRLGQGVVPGHLRDLLLRSMQGITDTENLALLLTSLVVLCVLPHR